uniref:Uncharacterized protein n=1 Tax=Romanomermis culicivorax TaxID=13658 RepID=A0A915JU85_ROMCU
MSEIVGHLATPSKIGQSYDDFGAAHNDLKSAAFDDSHHRPYKAQFRKEKFLGFSSSTIGNRTSELGLTIRIEKTNLPVQIRRYKAKEVSRKLHLNFCSQKSTNQGFNLLEVINLNLRYQFPCVTLTHENIFGFTKPRQGRLVQLPLVLSFAVCQQQRISSLELPKRPVASQRLLAFIFVFLSNTIILKLCLHNSGAGCNKQDDPKLEIIDN